MKSSVIQNIHERAGARLGEFAGWNLPLDYGSSLSEVKAVRTAAGLFDISHMGRFELIGDSVAGALQNLLTNDVSKLSDGGGQYTLMCNPEGGVIDDVIVFQSAPDRFYLVVNASNLDKDKAWIARHLPSSVKFEDFTPDTAMFAIQGPKSVEILSVAGMSEAGSVKRFHFASGSIAGNDVIAFRTGYSGEDGFEIVCRNEAAESVWTALISCGGDSGLVPCGLAARDVLRIEAALPLYGHEIDEDISPVEARLMRWVKLESSDFIGRGPIADMQSRGPDRALIGVQMNGRFVPRAGDVVTGDSGTGAVASGTFSPTLGQGVAMAYMPAGAQPGEAVEVLIHDKSRQGSLCSLPFYSRRKLNVS